MYTRVSSTGWSSADGFDQGEKETNVINIVVDAIKSQPPK